MPQFNPESLKALARMPMPFGKHQGTLLIDLPEPYVVWFKQQGFPQGQLGELLALLYEIKSNGLEPLLEPFRAGNLEPQLGDKVPAATRF